MNDFVARLRLEATAQQLVAEVGRGTTAVDGLTRANQVLSQANAALSDSTDRLTAAQQRAAAEVVAGAQVNERAASSMRQMAEAIAATEAAERRKIASSAQLSQATQAAAKTYVDFASAWDAHQVDFVGQYQAAAKAASNFGKEEVELAAKHELNRAQQMELAHVVRSVTDSMIAGVSPARALGMESARIGQIIAAGGGLLPTLEGVGAALAPLVGTAGLFVGVAAAVGIAAVGFVKGSEEAAKFQNAVVATGNFAGITASSYEAMARRVSKANDVSIGTSKAAILQLVATGQFSTATIEKMATAAERYSQLTGKSTSDILKDYSDQAGGIVKWAAKHAQTYHDLTFDQIKYIQKLEEQGQHEAAEAALFDDIQKNVETKAKPAYGALQNLLHGVAVEASNMWDKILGIGRPKTLDEQIKDAQAKVNSTYTAYNLKEGNTAATQALRQQYEAQLQDLQRRKQTEDAQAAADAKKAAEQANLIQKNFLDPRGGKGPQDQSQLAIDGAVKAQLAAQLALTKDVELAAQLKHEEVANELKAQLDRLKKDRAEKSITQAALEEATTRYQDAARLKNQLIDREKENALAQQQLERRQAVGAYLDRAGQAQSTLAGTVEEQNAIELEAMARRQELERDVLDQKLKEQVQAGNISQAQADQLRAALGLAQAEEATLTLEQQRQKTVHDLAQRQQASLQNQVDLLSAQSSALKSAFARNVVDAQILELQHQIQLSKAQEAVAAAKAGSDEQRLAQARLETLRQVQAAEARVVSAETTLFHAIENARSDIRDLSGAISSHDWLRLFDDLEASLQTMEAAAARFGAPGAIGTAGGIVGSLIGGKAGNALSLASGLYALPGLLTSAGSLGALGGLSGGALALGATLAPIAAPIAIVAGLASLFLGSKPSNEGAGFDLITGQLSGNKRTAETENAAKGAGSTISQGEQLLRSLGADLPTIIRGVVLGTRDQTQIYTNDNRTLYSAVGDPQAAADTALKAVLRDATFTDKAEQQLVQSMLDAGKGFDDITTALQSYAAAQQIPQQIDDAILKLTDPKASALQELQRQQKAFRDQLKAAADAGYLTADAFAKASAKLDTLEQLQTDEVLKRFTQAVEDSTDALTQQAKDMSASVSDQILQLTDPTGYQIKKINDDIDAQIAKAQPLIAAGVIGTDIIDQLQQLRGLQLQNLFSQLAANVQKTTDVFAEARPKLQEWLDAQATGPNSGLSPKAQRDAALANYQKELALAQSGDANALAQITGYADTLKSADRAATSSASARLALSNRIDADIAALAARGLTSSAAQSPAAAIATLQQPLNTIAQAAEAQIAANAAGGQPVILANLPSVQAMYAGQVDRIVASNDDAANKVVAAIGASADRTVAAVTDLVAQVGAGLGQIAGGQASQLDQVAAAVQALADQTRLADAYARSGR